MTFLFVIFFSIFIFLQIIAADFCIFTAHEKNYHVIFCFHEICFKWILCNNDDPRVSKYFSFWLNFKDDFHQKNAWKFLKFQKKKRKIMSLVNVISFSEFFRTPNWSIQSITKWKIISTQLNNKRARENSFFVIRTFSY